jgi:N-acetylmuramoyl-L-alanine amidase CwlA
MAIFKSLASFCKNCINSLKGNNCKVETNTSTAVEKVTNEVNHTEVTSNNIKDHLIEEDEKTEKDLPAVEHYDPINLTVVKSHYEFAHGKKFKNPPKWIVVHYTACAGTGAAGMCRSMSKNAGASSHFYVDSKDIYASVPTEYVAWHVCGGQVSQPIKGKTLSLEELSNYKSDSWRYDLAANNHIKWKAAGDDFLGNYYSLSIDLCVCKKSTKTNKSTDEDWYFRDETVNNTAKMVAYLAKKYNIDLNHIIRHSDATGKLCPQPFAWPPEEGDKNWAEFINKVNHYRECNINVNFV